MIEYKQFEDYGNDCIIYRTVTLQPLGDFWIITTLKIYRGSWFDDNTIDTTVEKFQFFAEAKEHFDSIK